MQALAVVQLAANSAAECFVGDVAALIDGAHESAVVLGRPARESYRLLQCTLAMSRLAVFCRSSIEPTSRSRSFQ